MDKLKDIERLIDWQIQTKIDGEVDREIDRKEHT